MNVTVIDCPSSDTVDLDEWRQTWQAHPSPPLFCHPDWVVPWWRTVGRRSRTQPRLLLLRDGPRLVGVAPLQIERWPFGMATVRNAGAGVSDYNDWLLPPDPADRDAAAVAIFDQLIAGDDWVGFVMDGLPEMAALLAALPALGQVPVRFTTLPGMACPYVELRGSFQDLLDSRPGRFRYNLRSRKRRLEGLGHVEILHATADEAPRFVEESIRLHAHRWRGQYTSTVFSSSPAGRAFYRVTLPSLLEQGLADLVSLRLDDRAIATSVGFVHGNRYAYYLPAWDPAYHAYAPSALLLAHMLEYAFELGLTELDFMLGDEEYKRQWASGTRTVTTLLGARDHASGSLWLGKERAARALRAHARRSERLQWLRRYGLGVLRRSSISQA